MAKLRKYQIDAIRSEIRTRLKERKKELKQTEEYATKCGEIEANLIEQCQFVEYEELEAKRKALKSELEEIKKKKNSIKNNAEEILDCRIRYSSPMEEQISKVAEIEALQEMGFSMHSSGKITNAIVVADLDGADDIIEAVIEKLNE